jgi:hypothetical protein
LKEQISDDEKYIAQVEKSLAEKKEEWKTRSALRTGELAAISKAISILSSDDARDLIKKSITSQGYSFFQDGQGTKRSTAADTLHAAAAGDRRLLSLSAKVAAPSHFDDVISAIDNMVETLGKEEASELLKKEGCEKDRMDDTRAAAVASRTMDEHTEAIMTLEAEIKELEAEIVEKQEEAKKTQEALDQATRLREDEAAAYAIAKKDDEDAAKLVLDAKAVLEKFYADNSLMLAQQPFGAAGEAPPPPPKTWEAPYGGKTGEQSGIIATLALIHEDIMKDIAKATTEEDTAIADYGEFKSDSEKQILELNSLISTLEGDKAQKGKDAISKADDRRSKGDELKVVMKKIKDVEPGCDYFTINYPVRSKNRQIEVDGLQKAKAILSGGEFGTPEDTTRELKPGDAFLQRVRHHS